MRVCPTCGQRVVGSDGAVESPALDELMDAVCELWRVSVADVLGPRRFPEVTEPRQALMYLATTRLGFSQSAVARWLGMDRTTVAHASKSVAAWAGNGRQRRRLEAAWAFTRLRREGPPSDHPHPTNVDGGVTPRV